MKASLFLIFITLILSSTCFGQETTFPMAEASKSEVHSANVGKIFFTDRRLPYDGLGVEQFLSTYQLTNKSNLFFVAFFEHSLTNHQHMLLPGLPADSLFRSGNYQFSLYIDDQLIYQSELLPGAPSANSQNHDTHLNRPLIDNINGQGSWSESFWNRFLRNGGDKALTDGRHVLKMEIRPYVKTREIHLGAIMASGELPLEVNRHPLIDISKISLNKTSPYAGLEVSTSPFDTNRIKSLKGAIDEGIFKKVNGIVVLKHGKILIEEYFNGENRFSLHDPRSVGKSFASTLTGMAIQQGFIKSESANIGQFYELDGFQNNSAAKTGATIRDLLTMSSGFAGDDEDYTSPGNEENMYPTEDWVKFALDLPYQDSLKKKWHYFTAGVVLLGDIINKSVPNGLEDFAQKRLFEPLGITDYKWQYTPQLVPNTAGGIQMNALDFAKYGQLYKNGGIWNNQRLLAKSWVDKSFTKHRKIQGRDEEYYGYLFWNKKFKAGSKTYEAFYCAGNGGNYILIFKDQPLVVVITASAYGQPYAHSQVHEILSNYILPSVLK